MISNAGSTRVAMPGPCTAVESAGPVWRGGVIRAASSAKDGGFGSSPIKLDISARAFGAIVVIGACSYWGYQETLIREARRQQRREDRHQVYDNVKASAKAAKVALIGTPTQVEGEGGVIGSDGAPAVGTPGALGRAKAAWAARKAAKAAREEEAGER